MSVAVSDVMNYENEALLTAAFTNTLKANLIKLGTIHLTNDSKVSLTSIDYLSILITLNYI